MNAVMPLANLAQRMPVVATLRNGATKGKRPVSLDKWRVTTGSLRFAEAFADRYGGEVQPWRDGPPNHYEVFSDTTEVTIALIEDGFDISYQLWTAGGMQRKCNGLTCEVLQTTGPDNVEYVEGPCICDRKGQLECSLRSRLTFVLPDLPFGGGVTYKSGSKNFAEEAQGMLRLLNSLRDSGVTRGVLRLEQRKSSGNRRYTIAVVGVTSSLEQIAAGQGMRALAPAAEQRPELSSPTPNGEDGESDTPLAESPTSSGAGEGEASAPEPIPICRTCEYVKADCVCEPDAGGREGDRGAAQPSLGGEDIIDAELVEEEPPAFRLPKDERARMRAAFMARVKGLGLDYDTQVRAWIQHRYKVPEGEGWSALSDEQASSLYDALIVPDGSRAEKDAAAEKFKAAVLDTVEAKA